MSLPSDDFVAQTVAATRGPVVDAVRTVRSPKRSTRYRTTRNLIIAGVAIAALTAGAIIVAQAPPEFITGSSYCFEHPALDSRTVPVLGSNEEDGSLDPVQACALIWSENGFVGDPGQPMPGPGTVPPLIACELGDGTPGVFPLEDQPRAGFCDRLGLPEWPAK